MQNLEPKEILNIRVAVVAAEVIGYCLQNIEGKQLFKQRLGLVKNSVKTLESFFGEQFKKEFCRNEYVMFKNLLEETIEFDDDTLEEIIEAIKKNIVVLK